MSLISISNLTFAYDGSYDNVFEDTSFAIDTDWRLGFTGRNGRGKTTFLNLLMGKHSYSGRISSSVDFDYFPFAIEDDTLDTLEIAKKLASFEDWELMRELSLLDVDCSVLYRPFYTLSKGEQTKTLLAVLFLRPNNFLLIDEPTNHLDMEGRKIVSDYLRSKKGFILVSHDRTFLDNCIDHVLSINRQNIEVIKGNFSTWWIQKELRDNFELAENEKLKHDIKRLKESARQANEWADSVEASKIGLTHGAEKSVGRRSYMGEKSRRMQMRRKNLEHRQNNAIDEKSTLLKNIESSDALKLHPQRYHSNRLLTLDDVSVSYDDKSICEGVSFTVEQGDRIALSGKNGSGKSSILKLILGEKISHNGTIHLGSGVKISYVSQDTSHLKGKLSDYAEGSGIDESLFKAILRKLDFSRIQLEKSIEDFSGGQKKKVLIAKSLCEKAHLYIWDEPLNFVDVLSRIQIEELLLEFMPTIIFVEHDKVFSDKIKTKTVQL